MTTHRSAASGDLPPAAAPAVSLVGLDGLPVVGVSLGHPDTATAEHWLASLPEAPLLACTHLVREPRPHVALSLVFAATRPVATTPIAAVSSIAMESPIATAPAATESPAAAESPAATESPAAAESPVAAAEHRARSSGRAALYPGVERLVGTLSVAEIIARSAIDRVDVLGGGPADPETLVDTGDFVRPQWHAGALTLTTTPAAGGRLVPFETRHPTPCCSAH
jgi:hypothetical protein